MIDFARNPAQQKIYDQVHLFAKVELGHNISERDKNHVFDQIGWEKSAQQGLMGLTIAKKFGGMEYDVASSVAALEGLGYGCRDNGLIFSIGAHLWGCVTPINLFGSEEQKRKYLPNLSQGLWIGGLAATELNAGSDVAGIMTTAKKVKNGYYLTGKKIFVTNAPLAKLFIVLARLEGSHGSKGICAFILSSQNEQLLISENIEKIGLCTAPMGELTLNQCFVPDEDLLAQEGMGMLVFATAMEWERGLIVAPAVGTMQRQLEELQEYVRTRKQFNQPINQFQRVADKIIDMYLGIDISRLLILKFASLKDNGRYAVMESSMAKLYTSEAWVSFSENLLQLYGGSGYLAQNSYDRDLRDALGSKLYSGTSEIQREIIADWLK